MKVDSEMAIDAILDLVPQWYKADGGPNHYVIECNGEQSKFYSHQPLTPLLSRLLAAINEQLPIQAINFKGFPPLKTAELLQEYFAKVWLQLHKSSIDWDKLFNYFEETSKRTYENNSIIRNFIIDPKTKGDRNITDKRFQKILDPLASSLHTYFRVDADCNFIDYQTIEWNDIRQDTEYQFHPEFLHPMYMALNEGEFSAHLTTRGDWVIMSNAGLLATRRKGGWKIYDVHTMKNSIVECLGGKDKHYRIGCNLFEILFDLSFKRHGALVIYDPDHTVLEQIQNPESIITEEKNRPDLIQAMLSKAVYNLPMSAILRESRKKRIFLEIASIDGAVIFDQKNVLAFGSMIKPHAKALNINGARSIAALSAYLHGGIPFKISADGNITIYFKSKGWGEHFHDASLNFL